jgi:predicted amidophosphoribosyltransferase
MIRCGYCGHEFPEEEGIRGCGSCGKKCHMVRCPKCLYENPPEPALVKKVRGLFKKGEGS